MNSIQKWVWLGAGALLGWVGSVHWPAEPAFAASADSNQKLSMVTVETQVGQPEAVFVLDHLTGRLSGAAYNYQAGTFNQSFLRSIAADFGLMEGGIYVMAPGLLLAQGRSGGDPPANGAIYVAEMTSGKVGMYGFRYSNRKTGAPIQEISLITMASFREAAN